MRKTREEAEQTRKRLLEASYELIKEEGYDRLTQAEIAERAGMTRGAVNWHFRGKEEIYLAVLSDILDKLEEQRIPFLNNPQYTVEEQLYHLFFATTEYTEWFVFVNSVPGYLKKKSEFAEIEQRKRQRQRTFINYLEDSLLALEKQRGRPFYHDKRKIAETLYFLYEGLSFHAVGQELVRISSQDVQSYLQIILQS